MASGKTTAWINGTLVPGDHAVLSPWDQGFTVGHGAFETLRAYGGRPFALRLHWQRLEQSCHILGLACPSSELFADAMRETLIANDLAEARVRFTVSGGVPQPGGLPTTPTLVCTAVPVVPVAPAEAVVTSPWPRNERSPISGAKSLSYGENLVAMNYARQRGAGEAMFANTRGELCEGTATNVFLVRDGTVVTPPLTSGCLPGVTRALVLRLCHEHKIPASEQAICSSALSDSDEAFLTSSLREVQPISSVDGVPLSESGGPFTRRLAGLFRELTKTGVDP